MPKEKDKPISGDAASDFSDILREFADETDRATVILGAAKLDAQLYELLVKVLQPNATSVDDLFDGDAPLSTFSAKINLSYRLGLLGADLTRALHIVRKVRNSFAHEISSRSLEASAHKNRVRELISPLENLPLFNETKDAFFDGKSTTAANFRTVLAVLISRLYAAISAAIPISNSNPVSFAPPLWLQENEDKIDTKSAREISNQ